jgi:hypothetical protein
MAKVSSLFCGALSGFRAFGAPDAGIISFRFFAASAFSPLRSNLPRHSSLLVARLKREYFYLFLRDLRARNAQS